MNKRENKKKKNSGKTLKKRVLAGTAAAFASTGVLLAGLFGSPEELTAVVPDSPAPIVCAVSSDDSSEPEDADAVIPEQKRRGLFARLKLRILALPAAVRAVVGVPLWCVGWVLLYLGSQLWGHVLSPVFGWLLAGLLLLAVLLCAVKAAYPDMPLKKILSKRTLGIVIIGMLITGAADLVCSLAAPDNTGLAWSVRIIGSSAVLLLAGFPLLFPPRRPAAVNADTDAEIRHLEDRLFSAEK